jgi:hypothetical protein
MTVLHDSEEAANQKDHGADRVHAAVLPIQEDLVRVPHALEASSVAPLVWMTRESLLVVCHAQLLA